MGVAPPRGADNYLPDAAATPNCCRVSGQSPPSSLPAALIVSTIVVVVSAITTMTATTTTIIIASSSSSSSVSSSSPPPSATAVRGARARRGAASAGGAHAARDSRARWNPKRPRQTCTEGDLPCGTHAPRWINKNCAENSEAKWTAQRIRPDEAGAFDSRMNGGDDYENADARADYDGGIYGNK